MNKKYLIALDLDGTLLKDDKTISSATKDYLKELENQGHLVVLTSGRALRSVLFYYKDIGLKSSPVIAYNGHYALDPIHNSFKIINKINKNTAKSIYSELIDKYIDSAMSENESTIYVDKNDHFLFAFYEKNQLQVINGPLNETIKDDVLTFVMKMNGTANCKQNIINVVSKYNDVQVRFWSEEHESQYCELYLKGISKAKTILEVANKYGIDLNNIITFGDADNDIEMLSDFSHSYLMKNGNPWLNKYAKKITRYSNEEDGVIFELKEFFK